MSPVGLSFAQPLFSGLTGQSGHPLAGLAMPGFAGIDPNLWGSAPQFGQTMAHHGLGAQIQQLLHQGGPDNEALLHQMIQQQQMAMLNSLMMGQLEQALLAQLVVHQLQKFGRTGPGQRHPNSLGSGNFTPSGPGQTSQAMNNPGPLKPGTNGTATFDRVSKSGQLNQMVEGRITVNGRTYKFRSGGGGRGNLPPGQYKVTRHLDSRNDKGTMQVGGVGYSFAMSDKYDSRVGGTRRLLRIHPDGLGAGTIGCIGIVGDAATQQQFRADMLAELKRNGGSYTLQVG